MVKRLQILAALALLTASPAQGELPTYTCVKTAAAPRIDGRGEATDQERGEEKGHSESAQAVRSQEVEGTRQKSE